MSRICNIILLTLNTKNSEPIRNLNAYLVKGGYNELLEVSTFWNGEKELETYVYIGAYNYLNANDFEKIFEEQPFTFRNSSVLMIRDEGDVYWKRVALEQEIDIKNSDLRIREALVKKSKQLANAPQDSPRNVVLLHDNGDIKLYKIPNHEIDDINPSENEETSPPEEFKKKVNYIRKNYENKIN